MSQRCVVGVDLGGTNVRAGTYWEDGSSAGPKFSQSSCALDGAEATIRAIAEVVIQAAKASSGSPIGLGLAIPGHIDDPRGLVRWTPNFGETKNGSY